MVAAMQMGTPRSAGEAAPRVLELAGRVVLLATDGSAGSLAAAHVAMALAREHGAEVRVVNVVDTRGAPIPPPLDTAIGLSDLVTGDAVHAEQAEQIRAALGTNLGADVQWAVRVTLGTPARAIAREAKACDAALVVVGLRRHGRFDRAIDDETTLNLMRIAPCPVLGVVEGVTSLPRRVLSAMDFSQVSITALRAAVAVTGAHAKLILAYVPPFTAAMADDGEAFIHKLGVDAAFTKVAEALKTEGTSFDHVVLQHTEPRPVAELLLEYAETTGCDVVAAGAGRHGRIERWILGSVSTALVRDGRRSVLVVPPPE